MAGETLTISQEAAAPVPPPCDYTLSQQDVSIGAGGGSRNVEVHTDGTCAWTAVSTASWISVESGAAGTGKGSVKLRIDENPDASARTGIVRIAGIDFTVQQDARGSRRSRSPAIS